MRTGYRRKVEVELTPRQRDVLKLIARGKTNFEIAQELGIGYESVKSHVSEVLGRLGVDRREEAAAWWHEEHSLSRRVVRIGADVAAFVPRGAGAFAAAAAILLLGALLAALLLWPGNDDAVPVVPATEKAASESPTTGASDSPTTSPAGTTTAATATAATPAPTATAVATVPSVVAGRPVKELIPGPQVEFPPELVAYVAFSPCSACGWPPGDLWRLYRGRDGRLVADHTMPEGVQGYVPLYAISPDGTVLVAGVCSSYCGGEADVEPDAVLQFFESRDGGITWSATEGAALSGVYAWFTGWYAGEVVVNAAAQSSSDGSVTRLETYLLPSFRKLDPPPDVAAPAPGLVAMVGPDGGLVWRPLNGTADSDRFHSFDLLEAVLPGTGWQSRTWGETSPGTPSGVWLAPGRQFFVEVDDAGAPVEGFTAAVENVTFAGRISATTWLGTAVVPFEEDEEPHSEENVRAVLIDKETGLLHPIADLRRDLMPVPGNFAWPRIALVGTFWRVATDGSCLNIRQSPSTDSPAIDCFRDGVLLRERSAEASPGWLAVTAPDSREGFAAADYLE